MAGPAIKVEGLQKCIKSLETVGVEVKELKMAMSKGSSILADSLRSTTPVVTGTIAGTIREGKAKGRASATIGRNPTKLAYAPVLNYWNGSAYKGFVQKAVFKAKDRALKAIEKDLNRIIRKNGF